MLFLLVIDQILLSLQTLSHFLLTAGSQQFQMMTALTPCSDGQKEQKVHYVNPQGTKENGDGVAGFGRTSSTSSLLLIVRPDSPQLFSCENNWFGSL